MKFLFDFFPLIAFYATYKIYDNDIFYATGAIVIATIIQIAFNWFKHRKIEKMHIITVVLVTFFGGLTIALHDPVFIKWKVSVVNWLFGIILIGSQLIGDKTIIERMLSNAINVADTIWIKLNLSWALFFISMGFLNWYVFVNYSESTWVDFKVYGMLGLTFLFVVIQGVYLSRHMIDEDEDSQNKEQE